MSLLHGDSALRRRYYRRMRNAIVAALGLHVAVFALTPPFVPKRIRIEDSVLRLVATASSVPAAHSASAEPLPATEVQAAARADPAIALDSPLTVRASEANMDAAARDRGRSFESPVARSARGAEEDQAPAVFYAYDVAPRTVRSVEPVYPLSAREAGVEGTVVINVNVDERGAISRAWVAAAAGPDVLRAAALDAIYQFEFSPGSQRGTPVPCTVAVPFKFTLNHSR